jgi:hypothetical protein
MAGRIFRPKNHEGEYPQLGGAHSTELTNASHFMELCLLWAPIGRPFLFVCYYCVSRAAARRSVMKDRTHFAYRIDCWDDDGENIVEHLAGAEDFTVAKAAYKAACKRWPNVAITLRQDARVIEDSRAGLQS